MKRANQFFKEALDFFFQIYLNRHLLVTLCTRDFQKRYIRNFFGFIWAILDPLAFIVILYFVFGARYGNKEPGAIPFIVYLITGYIAFNFFSESLVTMTITIKEHAFLLKKVNFRVAVLPIVTMLSNLMVHAIVLLLSIVVLFINGIYPGWYWVQLLYYLFALSVLLIATGWFVSSIYLFFPDIKNIVNILTRVMFFITPIFWNMNGLPEWNRVILKINPVYYIVNGYRDSLLYDIPFWKHPLITGYFWLFTLLTLLIGVLVFKKLRPHFADVVD